MLNQLCLERSKGSLSISALVILLLAAITVVILLISFVYVIKGTSKDSAQTESSIGKHIHNLLPIVGNFIFLFKHFKKKSKKGKGLFAIRTLFYLLLGILVVVLLTLLVLKAQSHSHIGVEIRNPRIKIECSQQCSLSSDYEGCYNACIKEKNKEAGGRENDEKQKFK